MNKKMTALLQQYNTRVQEMKTVADEMRGTHFAEPRRGQLRIRMVQLDNELHVLSETIRHRLVLQRIINYVLVMLIVLALGAGYWFLYMYLGAQWAVTFCILAVLLVIFSSADEFMQQLKN